MKLNYEKTVSKILKTAFLIWRKSLSIQNKFFDSNIDFFALEKSFEKSKTKKGNTPEKEKWDQNYHKIRLKCLVTLNLFAVHYWKLSEKDALQLALFSKWNFSFNRLKGQCHEICDQLFLLAQKIRPSTHMNRQKRFHKLFCFREDIRSPA